MTDLQNKHRFDSHEFEQAFHTDVPLGAFCGEGGSIFRLWAPTAQKVLLRLYAAGADSPVLRQIELQPMEKGCWEYCTEENLDGFYYDYGLWIEGQYHQATDPYGKACGVNGERSMVLDLRSTDPKGWQEDQAPARTEAQIIYELHIKDFSWDKAGGFSEAERGRFSGLAATGKSLHGDGIHPTGLDYLKDLGITHIQILPMYDYGSVDERCPQEGYNWGYDPVQYNIPEGCYSSNPYDGRQRIRELKEMIAALHREGFRVIMDVVYNHTYHLDSNLFHTVPWYFYRQTEEGLPSNGSGCGNDIASERSMCARYILDSVLYWAQEYHIDGFRFDLMGLLDVELMNHISEALDSQFGTGEKLIYGEPWSAAATAQRPGTLLCTKENLKKLHGQIGAFCDDTRDAIKGSVLEDSATGFVNSGKIDSKTLGHCLTAWTGENGCNQSPAQAITYLSCHDDWTLWDKLVYTMDAVREFRSNHPEILRANRLAAAIYLSCQGRCFIHAGEEFGRSKGGVKNSYCSPAELNQLDWQQAWQNRELVDYYRGLIALRKQLPGVIDQSEAAKNRLLWTKNFSPHCAAACMDNRGEGSRWKRLLLIFHCGSYEETISLPDGSWQVLVNQDSSFLWQQEQFVAGTTLIPPRSALILGETI